MLKVTAIWTGAIGLPGYTNMYFAEPTIGTPAAQSAHNAVAAWFDSFNTYLPQQVTVTVQPNVQSIDPATGELEDEFSVTPAGTLGGGTDGNYAAPSGACVTWRTVDVVGGRRVRGRTFIVPLKASAYDGGSLTENFRTEASTGCQQLLANGVGNLGNFGVWHRPVNKVGGSFHAATSFTLNDKVAILTSRRD